jgi:hypothetical protein
LSVVSENTGYSGSPKGDEDRPRGLRDYISKLFNGPVNALVLATDGSGDIYAGGYFTNYQSSTVDGIAALNPDGSIG